MRSPLLTTYDSIYLECSSNAQKVPPSESYSWKMRFPNCKSLPTGPYRVPVFRKALGTSVSGIAPCLNLAPTNHSEYEIDGNESELKHLRLRLRAVEIVCYEYVPEDADPELLQSIENWKSDWATLKKNMTTRRRERHPHDDVPSAFSTPTASTL